MTDAHPEGSVRRRSVLAGAAGGLGLALAGCLSADADPADEVDCADADRPEPELPDDAPGDAIEPADYPEGPPTDESPVAYVEAYESAYRRNSIIEGADGHVVGFGASPSGEVTDRPADGTVVRLRYQYYWEVRRAADESPIHADSPVVVVAYYVDESIVLRAEAEGHDADAPDPLAEGRLLACHEG
jgi:hypothetical protein